MLRWDDNQTVFAFPYIPNAGRLTIRARGSAFCGSPPIAPHVIVKDGDGDVLLDQRVTRSWATYATNYIIHPTAPGTSAGYAFISMTQNDHTPTCPRKLTVDKIDWAPIPQYAVRGVYDHDSSATGFNIESAIGFNMIDSGPFKDRMDQLAARGLKGFVWLGGYSNTTCKFNYSDDWVRSHVSAVAGNPGVGAYFIDDEPDPVACPNVANQIKARSNLVKSIDPGPPTFMVDYKVDQFWRWAGKTDILGLDHYPCSIKDGCDFSKIDEQAAEADRLGIRYWGVIQAHGDDWYKVPTPEELHQEFVHWRATNMEGYLVFSWQFPDDDPALWLANSPELQVQLAVENAT
jgi:hypothetical protein